MEQNSTQSQDVIQLLNSKQTKTDCSKSPEALHEPPEAPDEEKGPQLADCFPPLFYPVYTHRLAPGGLLPSWLYLSITTSTRVFLSTEWHGGQALLLAVFFMEWEAEVQRDHRVYYAAIFCS